MISAADKKILAAAIADSAAAVYVINADMKPAVQKKLIDEHERAITKSLAQNQSIYFIHSRVAPK